MFNTKASRTKEIRNFEKDSAALAREIAGESIVLLKNEGILPLKEGTPLALYGEGAACTVKGGVGSGEVNARYSVSIWEGLKNAGFPVLTERWLRDYQTLLQESHAAYLTRMRKKAGFFNYSVVHELLAEPFKNPEGMPIGEGYLTQETDTCLYVLTRQAGEEMDRKPEKGDFLLTDTEISNIRICTEQFQNVILIINVGGYLDLSPVENLPIGAILFFCQQGVEGGNALADVLRGHVTPSGHLSSTWPMRYEDVPFGENFSTLNGNTEFEEYREGIYVGYRYYDSFHVEPRWPFGFGLSYTSFVRRASSVRVDGMEAIVEATAKNIGSAQGKDSLQLYVSCPAGKLDKEYQRLAAFAKTRLLAPGEEQTLTLRFSLEDLASYDESRDCFVLETGRYTLRLGDSSRGTAPIAALVLDREVIVSEHAPICTMQSKFEELHSKVQAESGLDDLPQFDVDASIFSTKTFDYAEPNFQASEEVQKLLASLKPSELHWLCAGSGLDIALPKHHGFIIPGACGYSAGALEKKGIPAISFCDGPAGLRLFDESVITGDTVRMTRPVMESFDIMPTFIRRTIVKKPKEGKMLYQYATAFPVGMALAQTWNTELGDAYGQAVQREMEAFGAEYWLAPGMNLHRTPLCGRNYEYYSEDPVLSGSMAASVCRGVQSRPGFGVTVKHFCCNNQEINRMHISENVSRRALRELYLRNFQIAVRDGKPLALMTSYNKVNGVYSAENHDTVTKVLRCEWGFTGLVMTDWTTDLNLLNSAKAMKAGVDMMMPGIASDHRQIRKALKDGSLSIETVRRNAAYSLTAITGSRLYREKTKGEKS